MDELVIVSVVIPFVLFVLCVAVSALLAQRSNSQLYERTPDAMPYTWGFFLGYSGIIGGVFAGVTGLVLSIAGLYQEWFPVALAYLVGLGIASYGVLTRRKWGWVFHIPLSLNPGLWAFNSIYVHNRWREFPWS